MKTLQFIGMIATVVLLACTSQDSQGSYAQVPGGIPAEDLKDPRSTMLDGMTFITDFYEGNGEDPAKDTLAFADGTCHSTMCDLYGFSKASYNVTDEDGNLTFSATTVSEVDGEMAWVGTVTGDVIEGEVVWTKEGQDPVTYYYRGEHQ